jgi:cytoskeletal protein CcmA (bactofilin family)
MMLKFWTKFFKKDSSKRKEQIGYNLIGKSTIITGNVFSEVEGFRIEGTIIGEIKTKLSVFVTEKAAINGILLGSNVVNFGHIIGNVTTENLELNATSKTFGTIKTKQLAINEGAFLKGTIEMSD